MSVIVNGNTYLDSADGKIYGQYPLGDAPVGGTGNGYLQMRRGKVEISDADSTVDIIVDRVSEPWVAITGTATVDVSISAAFNETSGRLGTSQTLSWASGETGPKVATFNVSAAAFAGPEIYQASLTNPSGATLHSYELYQPTRTTEQRFWDNNTYIYIDTSTIYPSAIYADPAVTNYSTPAGTVGDPKAPLSAIYEVETSVSEQLVYIRAGTITETNSPSSAGLGGETSGAGSMWMKNTGTSDKRILVLPYPGESVIMDNNITVGTGATTGGFFTRAAIDYWWVRGIEITEVDQHGCILLPSAGNCRGVIFDKINAHHIDGQAGANPAGVRFDDSYECGVFDSTLNNITEGSQLHLDAHDNNACVHGYRGWDICVENNTMHSASYSIFHKQAPVDDHVGYIIRGNLGYNTYGGVHWGQNDNLGAGRLNYRHTYARTYENIFRDTAAGGIVIDQFFEGAPSGWFDVYNNVFEYDSSLAAAAVENGCAGLMGTQRPSLWNNVYINANTDASNVAVWRDTTLSLFGSNTRYAIPEEWNFATTGARDTWATNNPTELETGKTLIYVSGDSWYYYNGSGWTTVAAPEYNSSLKYSDYNVYSDDTKFVFEYLNGSTSTNTKLTLAGIQAADNQSPRLLGLAFDAEELEVNGIESISTTIFNNPATNDYTLKAGSPALASGLNSDDIGAYPDAYSTIGVRVSGGVSEGTVTANAFFNWDVESAPLGDLTAVNSPFDEVDTYFAGAAQVSNGPSGVGSRSGSKCIRMTYRNGIDEDGSFFILHPSSFPNISDIRTIYARWWEYYEGFSGDWPLALKVARFWSGTDGDPSSLLYPYCSAKISNQFGMGSDGDQFTRGINHAIYNDDRSHAMEATDLFGNGLPYIREGRWYKHEMQLTLNTDYTGAGSADGIMRHWIDDVMFYEETDLVFGSENKGNGSYANGWNQMYFGGNYSGSTFGAPSKDLYRYIDDMYVSTTVDR